MLRTRSAGVVTAVALLGLAGMFACSSDPTRPVRRVSIDPRATHYSGLADAAAKRGDFTRALALSSIAGAYLYGVSPGSVTVQDSGTATVYRAAVARVALPEAWVLPCGDVWTDAWDIVLWQEPDADRFIHITGHSDSVSFDPNLSASLLHYGEVTWADADTEEQGVGGYTLLADGAPLGDCYGATQVPCTLAAFVVTIDAEVKAQFLPGGGLANDSGPPRPIVAASLSVRGLAQ